MTELVFKLVKKIQKNILNEISGKKCDLLYINK